MQGVLIAVSGIAVTIIGIAVSILIFRETHKDDTALPPFVTHCIVWFWLKYQKESHSQVELDTLFFSQERYNFRQEGGVWHVIDQHRWGRILETHDSRDPARLSAAKLNLELLGDTPSGSD